MKTIIITLVLISLASAHTIFGVEIGKEPNTEELTKIKDNVYSTDKLFNGEKVKFILIDQNINGKVSTITVLTEPKDIIASFKVFKAWVKAMLELYPVVSERLDIGTWEDYTTRDKRLQYIFRGSKGTYISIRVSPDTVKDSYNLAIVYYNTDVANEEIEGYNF